MFILLVILAIIVVVFLTCTRIVRINGDSMYPTLKEGEYYLAVRLFKPTKLHQGRIYVFKPPYSTETYVIKRLTGITSLGLFFEGDNRSCSYDSNDYGYIPPEEVKYCVLTKKGVNDFERSKTD